MFPQPCPLPGTTSTRPQAAVTATCDLAPPQDGADSGLLVMNFRWLLSD